MRNKGTSSMLKHIKPKLQPIQAINSTISSESIKQLLLSQYYFDGSVTVQFIQMGANDTYLVTTDQHKYIFRLYRKSRQNFESILYEIDFLLHLHAHDVPVSIPLKNSIKQYLVALDCTEGTRYGVLFDYASGDRINYEKGDAHQLSHSYGESLAKLHDAQSSFSSSHSRTHLDLDFFIYNPLSKLPAFFANRNQQLQDIQHISSFILNEFDMLTANILTPGVCHGDTNTGNVHINDEGTITFFDFDCCGQGWLEYDLACFKHGKLMINDQESWVHFVNGYHKHRNIDINDQAISLLVAMRQLWMLGLHADTALMSGLSWFNDQYFAMIAQFFHQWKSHYKQEYQK